MNKRRLNILYTTHQFFPDYGAGTELLTLTTAKGMKERGHAVEIISGFPSTEQPDPKQAFDQYEFSGLQVHRYTHSNKAPVQDQCIMEAEHNNRLARNWFHSVIQKRKPDIVHIFHLQRLSAAILEVCRELNIPYLITVTDFWMICPTTQLLLEDYQVCNGPQGMAENCVKHLTARTTRPVISNMVQKLPDAIIRLILHALKRYPQFRIGPLVNLHALTNRSRYVLEQVNHADRIFVTNKFMKNMLQTNGVRAEIVAMMPFGIEDFKKTTISTKPNPFDLTVGFIGTLNYHKGAHVLIEAISQIAADKKLSVIIYGDRSQFPEYVKRLDKMSQGDNRIKFHGTFIPDRIGSIFDSMDVLIIPSLWYENTPLVLHQAQAAKVPLIVSDLGGMNEAVTDRHNGYLFAPGNAKQLAAILYGLVENPSTIDRLRKHIVPPLFVESYVEKLEAHYMRQLDSCHRSHH